MTRKRTNFKAMDRSRFIAYLNDKQIAFDELLTTTPMGHPVIRIKPDHFRMVPRVFIKENGKQMDPSSLITGIDISKPSLKEFIRVVDKKINQMSTKGVYNPRRLKPKWDSLSNDKDKLELFTKYMKAPTSSIGFIRLVEVDLCNKTLESILIDYPKYESLIDIEDVREKCISKFKAYKNGKQYLETKGLILLEHRDLKRFKF